MAQSRSIAVIGLGTFGSAVARHLARFGDHVLGVDIRESAVARIADDLPRAVIADGREKRALEEAGIGSYDVAVVCTASDIEANLLTVMNAKDAGTPEVWAKAASSTHARILERVGVAQILSPEESFGDTVAQCLHNPLVKGTVRLSNDLHLAQVVAPKRVVGSVLGDVRFGDRHDLHCLGILRGRMTLPARPDEEIGEGDSLILVGSRPAMRAFVDRG
jgi:trk system potassium uptake protein TrkA